MARSRGRIVGGVVHHGDGTAYLGSLAHYIFLILCVAVCLDGKVVCAGDEVGEVEQTVIVVVGGIGEVHAVAGESHLGTVDGLVLVVVAERCAQIQRIAEDTLGILGGAGNDASRGLRSLEIVADTGIQLISHDIAVIPAEHTVSLGLIVVEGYLGQEAGTPHVAEHTQMVALGPR